MADNIDQHVASNFYFDKELDSKAVKLLPGEYYVTDQDMLLVTVLGSCVAACIRDRQTGIGGMNHFMLPENTSSSGSVINESARYGAFAMEILINQLLKLGALRRNLEAKVFGGGNVMKNFTSANVGERNAQFALNFLETEQIRVVAQDLVGEYPRKVYFFPKTSRVLVKKLMKTHSDTIFEREKDYSELLRRSNPEVKGNSVELFN